MPAVLITGANRGIGLEFARQYAADGWAVFAACRDPKARTEACSTREGVRRQAHHAGKWTSLMAGAWRSAARQLGHAAIRPAHQQCRHIRGAGANDGPCGLRELGLCS